MGFYINPTNGQTKEAWLNENGKQIGLSDARGDQPEGETLVCLVDNGFFDAAGIAFSKAEKDAFFYPDSRPKRWYSVPNSKLVPEFIPQSVLTGA